MSSKAHVIAYKVVCILIFSFLFLGSLGMLLERHYLKSLIGFVAGAIIAFRFFDKPQAWSWITVIMTLLGAMLGVGIIN